jgi:hypothetical protein
MAQEIRCRGSIRILASPDFDLEKGLTKGFTRGMVHTDRVTPELIAAYERPFQGVGGRLAYRRAARVLRTKELASRTASVGQLNTLTLIIWGRNTTSSRSTMDGDWPRRWQMPVSRLSRMPAISCRRMRRNIWRNRLSDSSGNAQEPARSDQRSSQPQTWITHDADGTSR